MDSPTQLRPLPPFFWPLGYGDPPAGPPADGRVIGHDEGTWFVVSPAGIVESRSSSQPDRLVNSTMSAFGRSLTLFRALWVRRARQSDTEAAEDVEEFRNGLRQIDPPAIENPDAWWALVLEQMGNDLL
jgi:hypothetical protein